MENTFIKISSNMKKTLLTLGIMLMSMMSFGQSQLHWQCDISQFADYMSVTAVVEVDGAEQQTTTLEIGAFCGDVCRGSKCATYFQPTQRYIYQIPVYGSGGDMITFRLYDHVTEQELNVESSVELIWQKDGYGRLAAPYVIGFVTVTITNTTAGDWNDPTIWGGTVPGDGVTVELGANCTIGDEGAVTITVANLSIPEGVALTIEEGSTLIVTGDLVNASIDGLVIEDGAQVVNSSPNVKATAHKNIQAWTAKDSNGWHLIASPVNEMEVAGSEFLTETYDLYRYNEATHFWENYRSHYNTDFFTFENGRGYLYANSNPDFSPAFRGDLNYETVSCPVSFASPDALKGFNLIGNPFPHKIYKGSGGAIDDSRLASGYYTLSYNGEWVAHTFEDEIMPGQGVLVKTTATCDVEIGKLTSAPTAETAAKDDVKRLKVNLSGNDRSDCAYAYFSQGIGLTKMENYSSSAAQIAIREAGEDFAIAHVGNDCEEMDVVFKNTKNGYYTVMFEGTESFEYLHLVDNIAGSETDMLQEQSYTFYAFGNEDENRFKVVLRDYTSIDEDTKNSEFAYIAGGNIIVRGEGTLQVIDMTGRIVITCAISGVETVAKPTENGVYVLRFMNGNNVKTQKIVVR